MTPLALSSPRVSVVMAVCNGERYIAEALDSIVGQDFTDWELIVVDDGSTDQSSSIVDSYVQRDSRIRLIKQANQGQTRALNTGIQAARGELLARIDADDIALPGRVKEQVAFLTKHPAVGLLGTQVVYIDEVGTPYCTVRFPTEDRDLRRVLIRLNPFIHSSVMFRRAVVQQTGAYDPRYDVCQDYDLWVRMAQVTHLANLDQALVHFRRHDRNVTRTRYRPHMVEIARIQWKAIGTGDHGMAAVRHPLKSLAKSRLTDRAVRMVFARRARRMRGTVRIG